MPLNDNVAPTAQETESAPRHKGSPLPSSQGPVEEISPVQDPHGTERIDVGAIHDELMGKWQEIRQTTRDMIEDPALHKDETASYQDQRKRVLEQLKILVDQGAVHR